ncbi:hypothetical protein CC86DRAFT_385686 [Ophiobolus disseminans]|uniref:Uncharacterized protein n=1 Tax=Ophiobolus disseminans TaxID=1469910 RepID=A0A6A6ZLI2_9PLEO|nr:hypothetical protein CC86DRAFT_385686 [Ophiobolus disseminans]
MPPKQKGAPHQKAAYNQLGHDERGTKQGAFQLDRAVRDMIYQFLWNETPKIKQRYKRRLYDVTALALDVQADASRRFHRVPSALCLAFRVLSQASTNGVYFPLMTPALVREHHLTIRPPNRFDEYGLSSAQPFVVDEYILENEDRTKETSYVLSPKASAMALVHLMTASTEAHDAGTKIEIYLQLFDQDFIVNSRQANLYAKNVKFDLSQLDRLAVHRRLRIFEVKVKLVSRMKAGHPERLEEAIANLMVELDIVAKALIPGGVAKQKGLPAGWSANLPEFTKFTFKMEKA